MAGPAFLPNSISKNEHKFRQELTHHFENLIDICNYRLFCGRMNMSYHKMNDIQRQFQIHIYDYIKIQQHNLLSTS